MIFALFNFLKSRSRQALAFCIIIGSVLWSFYLIFGQVKEKEDLSKKPLFQIEVNSSENAIAQESFNFRRNPLPNLTNEFTDTALKKVIADNENLKAAGAKKPSDYYLLPPKRDIDNIISKLIEKELAAENVSEKELLINEEDSKEVQLTYLLVLEHLFEKMKEEINLPDPNNSNFSLLQHFAETASKFELLAEILKSIKVPPTWLQIHRDLVQFFLRQKNIFQSLAAAEEDPLRFLIATYRILPMKIEKDFEKIQVRINQKIKDEKLI
jgi:hypothetical protein